MSYHPLFLSLKVATLSTVIVFVLGIISARIISRKLFPGKSFLESVFLLPLVLPPTVIRFGLLFLFGNKGWIGKWLMEWFGMQIVFSWAGAVIASTVVSAPAYVPERIDWVSELR